MVFDIALLGGDMTIGKGGGRRWPSPASPFTAQAAQRFWPASQPCMYVYTSYSTPPDSTIDYRSTSSTVKSLYSYNFENSCRARSFSRVMYQNSWCCFWEKLIRVLAQNEELVRDFLTCMNSLKRTRSVHKKYHIKLSTA